MIYHLDRVLAIETSAEACSVALAIGATVRERHQHAPLKHAELLLASIRALLDEADLGLGALDAIVFGRGPGGFTSLRIGIGAVQGLAWGAGLPVVPVSSLAAVAQQAEGAGAAEILVAMDARMDEVFSALFTAGKDGVLLRGEERVGAPEALSVKRPGETIGCGNGFERYSALRRMGRDLKAVRPDLVPRASALIPLALAWLRTNAPLPPEQAQPVYVRDHVADKP